MIKCEKCGAVVPVESKFCLNCGSKIDSNAPKHFSLEEISRQQQAQENSAFSITPDTPDDDPETYLPPIGAKEHSEIQPGEIDPQYFNHKPLPNIQAADPLELLDSDSPELPPIGFSDRMQVTDIPEGIRHYHGQEIVPVNLQMQTAFPVVRSGSVAGSLTQAQSMRQSMAETLKNNKNIGLFSVVPEQHRIRFGSSGGSKNHTVSFNPAFADEYIAERDTPPVKTPEAKKVSLEKESPQPPAEMKTQKPKVSLQKAPPKKVSLEKPKPTPSATGKEIPDTYQVSLDKKDEKPFTPPVEKVPESHPTVQNMISPVPAPAQPQNDFQANFSTPQPQNDFQANFSAPQPQNDFQSNFNTTQPQNGFMFSDMPGAPEPPRPLNTPMPQNYGYSPTVSHNSMNAVMTEAKNQQAAKIMLGIGVAVIAILIIAIAVMLVTGHYSFDPKVQKTYHNGSAVGTTISAEVPENEIKWSNLNNGGIAAEDDEGNVYYTNSRGCICKLDKDGKETIIYNGAKTNKFIVYIQYSQGKIFFLSSITGNNYSICSIDPDGQNFKIYTAKDKPAALFAHDGYLYYINEDGGKLNRINIETEAFEHIYTVPDTETINSLFILNDKIYVQCMPDDNFGNIYVIDIRNGFSIGNLTFDYMGQTIVPLSLTYSGDKIFVVDCSKYSTGQVYSANLDGSNVALLGGSNIFKIAAYGDNLYYFYMPGTLDETQEALLNGDFSGMIALGVMNTNGSRGGEVVGNILKYSYAGGRMYFVNFSQEVQSMLPDGTDIQSIS